MHLITGVSAENTNEGRVLKVLACVASPIKSLARIRLNLCVNATSFHAFNASMT